MKTRSLTAEERELAHLAYTPHLRKRVMAEHDAEREELSRANHKAGVALGRPALADHCEVCFLLRRLDEAREALNLIITLPYPADGSSRASQMRAIAVEVLKKG